jgi:hypothetical protein
MSLDKWMDRYMVAILDFVRISPKSNLGCILHTENEFMKFGSDP